MFWIFFSFVFIFSSYLFLPKTRYFFVFFIFLYFIYSVFSIFFIVGNYYTGVGVDESVIYHLFYGFDGAGVRADLNVFYIGIISALFYIFFIFIFLYFWKKFNFSNKKLLKIFSFFLIFISFFSHPLLKNFYDMGYFSFGKSKQNISYKIPEIKKNDRETKNLIFIYLESFEKLYLDENIFPGLAKNLQNLSKNSTYFENIEQAFGTSWTIAGMVGSQCGAPLINTGGGGNSMHGIEDFLPGAFCMGDFLNKSGYELSYVGGADLSFAGKGNFYKTHGFQNIFGKNELKNRLIDKNYQNDWGLFDDTTFEFVFEEFDRLSSLGKNFGLFTLSLDTHGNDSFVSKSCPKTNFDKKILNSYACSDFLLGRFLEKLKKHKNFENTIIVIASDHYAMKQNESSSILEKYSKDRKNLFLIINGETKNISKNGTTLDIGATVLGEMGFEISKLGFGVNLLKDEEKSIDNFTLRENKKSFEELWNFPSIKNGIDFDLDKLKVSIDGKNIGYPALIYLDLKNEIQKILWEDPVNGALLDKVKKNSIYLGYYGKSKKGFCLNFFNISGKKNEKCFLNSQNFSYENILKELKK
ncbi:hypothetical protein DLH72_02665 [Candidatus Gracilibacteria bacterium]|nr:MAG: hypothetical protein DLH72_02665 [Candidatus Gracilibacteria bacterium]